MAGNPTEVLARFAATLDYERIPPAPASTPRTCCSIRSRARSPVTRAKRRARSRRSLRASRSRHESSVIGGERLSLAGATLLNGYLVTAVTMCDIHRSTLTHVTPGSDAACARDRRT